MKREGDGRRINGKQGDRENREIAAAKGHRKVAGGEGGGWW